MISLSARQKRLLAVLNAIKSRPSLNTTELSAYTGLQPNKISYITQDFLKRGWIITTKTGINENHFIITKEGRIARICYQFLEDGTRLENVVFKVGTLES